MGVGKDKISAEVFNIEPTAIIDLFRVYPDIINFPDVYFNIHNGSVFGVGITWQGEDYMPIAMEYEGFEITADGRPNRPLVRFSNAQYFATSLLDKYDDFSNGRVQRKRTFVKFLDDSNFDGGNPWGEADYTAEISDDIYIVSQKKRENKDFVEVELTNPLDLESFEVNHRRILGKYCYWKYRGPGCQYEGPPVERLDRQPFTNQSNTELVAWNEAKTNNTSYLGQDGFEYGRGGDIYQPTKKYAQGNVVYKINDRIRIQDEKDPNSFKPMLVYYVAKASWIDGVQNKGKDPNLHPEYWDKDGCSKALSSCQKHFKNLSQVQVDREADVYDQDVFQTIPASLTHMGFLSPDAGLEYLFNWSYGSGLKKGRNRQFTIAIHLPRTYDYTTEQYYAEIADYSPIFASDARSTSDGFRLSFANNGYGDLVINCRERVSSTQTKRVEYWPLRAGGVEGGTRFLDAQNINLQSCKDLLIILKMKKTTEGGYKKTFDIEVTGINTGEIIDEFDVQERGSRGEEKAFSIKNSFDTDKVLRSRARRLTFLGGPTRRNSTEAGSPAGYPRNWGHNKSLLGGIAMWNQPISNNIIKKCLAERIFNDQDKTLILRRFQDLTVLPTERETLLGSCKAYWQGATSSGVTENITNRHLKFKYSSSDKVALAGQKFFDSTNWTKAQVLNGSYSKVETIFNISAKYKTTTSETADVGVLPFGGFPGTDGYSFRTEP